MNTVKCPNCGFENALGLSFCTNCGAQLSAPTDAPPAQNVFNRPPDTQINGNLAAQQFGQTANFAPKKSGSNWGLFAGLGCVGLVLGGFALLGLLIAVSSSGNNKNVVNASNRGGSTSNRNSSVANAVSPIYSTVGNDNSNSNSNGNSTIEAGELILPPNIGTYDRTASAEGVPSRDFPGADKVSTATYNKGKRNVDVIYAQFASFDTAKSSYADFLADLKSHGGKILVTQKVKDKSTGQQNGEVAIIKNDKKFEAVFYTEKYGIRVASTDKDAIVEFLGEFDKHFNK